MSKAVEFLNENRSQLDMFTTAITRAHGENHPEAFDVREIYESIDSKTKESTDPDLDKEFTQLREVTNHYDIPEDVCQTYAATYTMLSKADEAYQS